MKLIAVIMVVTFGCHWFHWFQGLQDSDHISFPQLPLVTRYNTDS